MGKKYCGLILKTSYPSLGETSSVAVLGKSMLDWVKLALGGAETDVADNDPAADILSLVRPHLKPDCDYAVVLYSDTPLITRKTVEAAVEEAIASGREVIRMTRGYVISAAHALRADKIYTEDTCYFDEEDFITAFSQKQIGLISDIMKNRILDYHMSHGVRFEDMAGTVIGCDVTIEEGAVIGYNNIVLGGTCIRKGARLKANNYIEDCIIDEDAVMDSSHAVSSYVGKRASVGPYANLRAGNVIGDDCHIGDFVELKACNIGKGCKMGHLTYAGNVNMGEECNVGAGVVFANYDGKDKHTTVVGKRAFIGSASTVVAPVVIEDGAFVAAGSVITSDVPSGALAIGRARQVVKPEWVGNKYIKKFSDPDDNKR